MPDGFVCSTMKSIISASTFARFAGVGLAMNWFSAERKCPFAMSVTLHALVSESAHQVCHAKSEVKSSTRTSWRVNEPRHREVQHDDAEERGGCLMLVPRLQLLVVNHSKVGASQLVTFAMLSAKRSRSTAQAQSAREEGLARTQTKTATLTLRVPPEVEDLLGAAVQADRRSLANMLEVIVLDHCERRGIRPATTPANAGEAR